MHTVRHYLMRYGNQGQYVAVGESWSDLEPGKPIALQNACVVLGWEAEPAGLVGLATLGPQGKSLRVTPTVPYLVITTWAEGLEVTPSAFLALAELAVCTPASTRGPTETRA